MENCTKCRERETERELAKVSKAGHEFTNAALHDVITKLWIALLVTIILLVGSNLAWIIYESQFETITQTEIEQSTDGNGDNYIVGGDYSNGTSESDDNNVPCP